MERLSGYMKPCQDKNWPLTLSFVVMLKTHSIIHLCIFIFTSWRRVFSLRMKYVQYFFLSLQRIASQDNKCREIMLPYWISPHSLLFYLCLLSSFRFCCECLSEETQFIHRKKKQELKKANLCCCILCWKCITLAIRREWITLANWLLKNGKLITIND